MVSNSTTSYLSELPTVVRDLEPALQVRLTEILDDYLSRLERGENVCSQDIIKANPELASALTLYLEKLEELHRLVGGSNDAGSLIGRRLGDYQLLREIGRGGMGLVFAARQASLDRDVAMKLLPMASLLDEKFIQRFHNEARATAQLEHPHIVPVFAIGEEAGIHFFVMKLINGQSLEQVIDGCRQDEELPTICTALHQFADIADALHAAHEYGIVHRDVKPSNLMLDHHNKMWIMDFGLARCQTHVGLTRTGEIIGTMRYMSPEQASGRAESVDHRTDIYSLGATLYEYLTLRPAVEGDEGARLLKIIETNSTPRLKDLRQDCPQDLQIVIDRAMATHKDDRYTSAKELSYDLRQIADGLPIKARPLSKIVLASRWMLRNRTVTAVGFAATFALVVGTLVSNAIIRWERNKYNTERQRASNVIDDDSKVIDELALIPGAESIRETMIRRNIKYYESFAHESKNDPKLQIDLAVAYSRMGMLFEELGRNSDAYRVYQKADEIYRRSPSLDGRKSSLINDNSNRFALLLQQIDEPEKAMRLIDIEIARLRRETTVNSSQQLGVTLNNRGLLLIKQSKIEEAEVSLRESLGILDGIEQRQGRNIELARETGAALVNLSVTLTNRDDEAAIQCLRKAQDLQMWVAENSYNKLRASRDLIPTYLALANTHLQSGNHKLAVAELEPAMEIAHSLVQASNSSDFLRDYATVTSNLAMAYFHLGKTDSAIQTNLLAADAFSDLVNLHPDVMELQTSYAVATNNLGIFYEAKMQWDTSESYYRQALEMFDPLPVELSQSQHDTLQKVCSNFARMLRKAGKSEKALLVETQGKNFATTSCVNCSLN